jgi:DNA repair exonuclease SbcCD nuclease subunit
MSRFVFFTDSQLSARCPVHRIDNYAESLLNKLREVYEIANAQKAGFVVCGGDFFNSHSIFSFHLINEIIDILSGSGLPTFSILGQHDIFGYNAETFKSSTLAFVERHCSSLNVIRAPVDMNDVVLYPCHCYDDFAECLKQPVTKKKKSILIAHKLISKKSQPFDIILTSDLDTNFDLVLSGDLHSGFAPHKVGKTLFCNPGAISRQAIDEVERIVKIALIDVALGKNIEIEEITLNSVRPAREVFGKTTLESVRQKALDTTAFVQGIEELESKAVDIFDFIEKVGKKQKVRSEILKYIASKRNMVETEDAA